MKNLLLIAVLLFSGPTFAGKMKEIWALTNESVLATLGLEEDYVQISGYKIIQTGEGEFAVHTKLENFAGDIKSEYQCVTNFRNEVDSFSVVESSCQVIH